MYYSAVVVVFGVHVRMMRMCKTLSSSSSSMEARVNTVGTRAANHLRVLCVFVFETFVSLRIWKQTNGFNVRDGACLRHADSLRKSLLARVWNKICVSTFPSRSIRTNSCFAHLVKSHRAERFNGSPIVQCRLECTLICISCTSKSTAKPHYVCACAFFGVIVACSVQRLRRRRRHAAAVCTLSFIATRVTRMQIQNTHTHTLAVHSTVGTGTRARTALLIQFDNTEIIVFVSLASV